MSSPARPLSLTTESLGALYEKNLNTSEVTTYYFAGSQRVAMRKGGVPTWFVADHPQRSGGGSTSLTLCGNTGGCSGVPYGGKVGEMKYAPFGETRYTWGSTPTDRRFTGQRAETGLGSLYDYGARMYSPASGRFISVDTLIASFGNPQSLNRYSYVYNRPINHTDPTGHKACDEQWGCEGKPPQPSKPPKGNTGTNGSGNTPADQATSADDTDGNDKGSGSPESPQQSREEQVQDLINAQRYDDAIALTIKLYGIRLHMPSRVPRFDYRYSLDDPEGMTDENGNIIIGIAAMKSPGWLASSIGHENVHVEQLVKDRWYDDGDGLLLNEVEAYDWEMRNAENNSLAQSERVDLAQRRYSNLYSIQDPSLQLGAMFGKYTNYNQIARLYVPQYTTP